VLRRLWSVEVFQGPSSDNTPVKTETCIAMNESDVHRTVPGEFRSRPEPLFYVTWPPLDNPGGPVYRIDNTTDGPIGDPISPSVSSPDFEGWNF
jgi:hypothetical protein